MASCDSRIRFLSMRFRVINNWFLVEAKRALGDTAEHSGSVFAFQIQFSL